MIFANFRKLKNSHLTQELLKYSEIIHSWQTILTPPPLTSTPHKKNPSLILPKPYASLNPVYLLFTDNLQQAF